MKEHNLVYVAIFTPNEENHAPYVYGLFAEEGFAREHFDKHGPKNGTLRITHEPVVQRPVSPTPPHCWADYTG